MTTKNHTHTAKTSRLMPFSGAIASAKRPNPKSHGGMTIEHTCRCGAVRLENANQGYSERGAWIVADREG